MLNQMKEALGLECMPAAFQPIYDRIADSWESRAATILSDEYILKILTDCYALADYREEILAAAAEVRKNHFLCLWVSIMEVFTREKGVPVGPDYDYPKGEGLGYDYLHLFPAIPTMPDSVAFLRNRNVPEEVIADTMQEYDRSVATHAGFFKRHGFGPSRLSWMRQVIHNNLLQIGRLRFELPNKLPFGVRFYRNQDGALTLLVDDKQVHTDGRFFGSAGHKEDDDHFLAQITETETTISGYPVENGLVQMAPITLEKDQWTLCLSPQDPVIKIHIPREGSFDHQAILASYQKARVIFSKCYPEYPFKAFYCASWLLSADLHRFLKPTSNILGFQSDFIRIPFKSSGLGVFSFVFSVTYNPELDLDTLPQETSLQRSIKDHYLNGGYVHEDAGIIF